MFSIDTALLRTGAVGSASDFGPRGTRFDPRQGHFCCGLEQVTFQQLNMYMYHMFLVSRNKKLYRA